MTLPYPAEPVGVGGFWMVTSRDGMMGLDLVSYRMVRVERVDGEGGVLTVATKRYAANSNFNLTGLEGKFKLEEFQSVADGTPMVAKDQPLPYKGMLKLNLGALIAPEEDPSQPGQIQISGQARFEFPSVAPPAQVAGQGTPGQPAPRPQRNVPAPQPMAPTPPPNAPTQ
jgi:hypothetical protein